MKINSLCQLIIYYNAILDFFIDSGFGELSTVSTHPAVDHFLDSYSELDSLLLLWKTNCSKIK